MPRNGRDLADGVDVPLDDVSAQTVGGPSGNARGTTLPGDRAAALLDRACASPIARHFLLYELYTRAAAFNTLAPPAE